MELNRTTTNKQTLRNLTNPFYLEVVMNRVNEVINHITRPTYTKSSRLRRTYDDINFKGNEFRWVDEGETREEIRMSDAFQVKMMLNEEFNIRTTEAHIQNFKNHYQTLITLDII
tara:strand:- start:3127 stop:3471 length:345 start_codon:yes stop_codon:yes gene_type:complete